ncbi:MAG: type 2 isopentenyl-diphosphate Delta-isomerase [Pseudobdellovibrionaceae bacterium]
MQTRLGLMALSKLKNTGGAAQKRKPSEKSKVQIKSSLFELRSFESRKKDHIRESLKQRVQALGRSDLDNVYLLHEALPELNFSEINIQSEFLDQKLSVPFFISSMTAGHKDGHKINQRLAELSHDRQILMGVGSQRRELMDQQAQKEWKRLRRFAPKALLLGNIGLAQLIQSPIDDVLRLIENTEALGFFVHTNPLQEVLQKEGTTDFRGGLQKLEALVKQAQVPIILKEVGCGFSASTLQRLSDTGVYAVDVAGLGGTHWGRLEGYRHSMDSSLYKVARTFANWGISTVQSVLNAKKSSVKYQVWASGGLRNGLDVAKVLSLGADKAGMALPFLQAALQGDKALHELVDRVATELKVALFCTGSESIRAFQDKKVWTYEKKCQ